MTRSTLVDEYDLYIGGRWVRPDEGRYDDISPVTEEPIAQAPNAGVAQVESAIGAARQAFDESGWKTDAAERARCLEQLSAALGARRDDIIELARNEWGCATSSEMLQIDVPMFMASRAAELAVEPVERSFDSYGAAGVALLRHHPLGVVSVVTPWNFPHSINVMKIVAALAAGNSVVLKPSPVTPLAGLALARIIDSETDIPPGVVNVVTPSGVEASKVLTTDPRVDMVSFTGSTAIGRQVMAAAGATMIRVLLECGGKSATVVLDEEILTDDTLRRMLYESCTLHSGQACILYSRLLLPDAIHDRVVERLVALAAEIRVGDPSDPASDMGPLVSARHLADVTARVERARSDGATIAIGGARSTDHSTGYYYQPTIITGADPRSDIAQEEVFGPVLTVFRTRDDDHAVEIANNTVYGLSGAVWGSDLDRAVSIARRMRTGQVTVNGCGPGDAPFGGFGQSGIGREGGLTGLHQYMELQAIGHPA